jgi:hypothetical protein
MLQNDYIKEDENMLARWGEVGNYKCIQNIGRKERYHVEGLGVGRRKKLK